MIVSKVLRDARIAICISATGIVFSGAANAAEQPNATLIIAHETDPDDATLFTYTLDGQSPGGAGLDDAPGPPGGNDNVINTKTFAVISGDYVIAQANPGPSWVLEAIKCDGPTPAYANLAGRSVALNVAPGTKITCRFYNKRAAAPAPAQGTISIHLRTIPDSPQDFSFTGTGPNGFSQNFTLDNDAAAGNSPLPNNVIFKNLGPGTYTFTQLAGKSPGWDLAAFSCGITSPLSSRQTDLAMRSAKITLGQGPQLVSCIFENKQAMKKARWIR